MASLKLWNWWSNLCLILLQIQPDRFITNLVFRFIYITLINENCIIMSALEIKLEIFDKLKNVEDVNLLEKIRNLLKNADTSEVYQFDQYELDMLRESEEDIKYGRVISQEDLDKEDLEWLSE
jgi:hypothetical protein